MNIYTETYQFAPVEARIGDIIRLKRFSFKLTDKGQVIGNENTFSDWVLYPLKQASQEIVPVK